LVSNLTIKVLKAISNPVRKSIVQSLGESSLSFSGLMRSCGLNPNHDTGPFGYHLSILVNLNIIEKIEDGYGLTEFGRRITRFMSTVEKESLLLLQTTLRDEAKMKEKEAKKFALKDGRHVIIRSLKEDELENTRQLCFQTFREDRYTMSVMQEKYQRHPSLFIGCFDEREFLGTIFGWPDYPEYPDIIVVKAIIVNETYRRKGIGTRLLKEFEKTAETEGFQSIVLGAEWEAAPFYIAYGLECFANIQMTLDNIPWNTMSELKSKHNVTGAAVFGPSIPISLVSRLNQEFGVQTKSVAADFESLSIQVKPQTITREMLTQIKRDFNAYSVQFAFRKELSN